MLESDWAYLVSNKSNLNFYHKKGRKELYFNGSYFSLLQNYIIKWNDILCLFSLFCLSMYEPQTIKLNIFFINFLEEFVICVFIQGY